MAIIYSWKHVEAFYRQEVHLDLAMKPLISTHHEESISKETLMRMVPHTLERDSYRATPERLFMPFTFGAGPVWRLGIEDGYLNHPYEPFTVLSYIIRAHFRELFDLVNGEVIENINDYNNICNNFNSTFMRCKAGFGRAVGGEASIDEMIRIGSLFYLLQMSCDNSKGLILDSDGRFCNPWNRKTTKINLDIRTMSHYSSKLSGFAMSGFSFQAFCDKYLEETKPNDLWLINVPKMGHADTDGQGDVVQPIATDANGLVAPSKSVEFSFGQMYQLMDMFQSLTRKRAYALAVIDDEDGEAVEMMSECFGITQHSKGEYRCRGMNVHRLQTGAVVLTNYNTTDGQYERVALNG